MGGVALGAECNLFQGRKKVTFVWGAGSVRMIWQMSASCRDRQTIDSAEIAACLGRNSGFSELCHPQILAPVLDVDWLRWLMGVNTSGFHEYLGRSWPPKQEKGGGVR